ncbi:exo-alpha-sialidase [Avibacterium endocarditidis]|uniref:exo-alpha-sialidase n=1 Tax=Avibacterium endocarditidis TaxID=380674 RepID=UPI0039EF4CFD
MKKTALAALISSCLISQYAMASNEGILDFKSNTEFFKPLNITETFTKNDVFNLENGSLTFGFKTNGGDNVYSLLGASTLGGHTNHYINFYMLRKQGTDTFGLELRNKNSYLINNSALTANVDNQNKDYQTITYTFDKTNNQIKIYVNGELKQTHNNSKFFKDIENLNIAYLGKTPRSSGNEMRFSGNIYSAGVTEQVLSEEKIKALHQELAETYRRNESENADKHRASGAMLTEKESLFQPNQDGAKNYRIPSLLTTQNGVVIAAIDKRWQHSADWGNIDTAIRRSFDGGLTWQKSQTVIDLASQSYGSQNSAFLIDPLMVQDKRNGRVFMIVDMFPETQGFFGIKNQNAEGSGYKNIGGKYYQLLTDEYNNRYTIRENGIVYNDKNKPTDYRVVINGNPELAFNDLGDLYQGDTRLGNIYLQTKNPNNDSAPLKSTITSNLWLTYSDNDGETWSNPVNINSQVKADWMRFMGTGPGTGIQLKDGSLVMPVYYTNNNNKQAAAVIISKDGGKTWERGESPIDSRFAAQGGSRLLNGTYGYEITESQVIELDNGQLKLFSRIANHNRVHISTSYDGGYTWEKDVILDDVLLEPYCQLSVIKYSKRINGKEHILFANPHSNRRSNGKVWLGEVQEDGSIEWKYTTTITPNNYAYSSLTELPNGDIGLLYEGAEGKIDFVRLNIQELVWQDNILHRDKRNTPFEYDRNSTVAETFYKIGDGEIIKIGEGVNPAKMVVNEGTLGLKQQEKDGQVQAYSDIIVNPEGTVKLYGENQIKAENLSLNKGTFDLNGNNFTIENGEDKGLQAETINGNIINSNATKASTLNYLQSGVRKIKGEMLGNDQGKLNFAYKPTALNNNHLTLETNSTLNELTVNQGEIIYAPDTSHLTQNANLANNATLSIKDNVIARFDTIALDDTSQINADISANQTSRLFADTQGQGSLSKNGEGTLYLIGQFNHTGKTLLNQGVTILEGELNHSPLYIKENASLTGNGIVHSHTYWQANAHIAPNNAPHLNHTANGSKSRNASFQPKTLSFGNVTNEGADITLNVDNVSENMTEWRADRVLINGDLTTTQPIPVNINLLNSQIGNSDTNKNERYDADEGISLIQVKGETSRIDAFNLAKAVHNDESHINRYALVSVEKGATTASENSFGENNSNFNDYRLQTLLINEDGEPLSPIIKAPTTPPKEESPKADDTAAPIPPTANTTVTPPANQDEGNTDNSGETTAPVDNAVVAPPSDQNGGNANNSTETTSPVDNAVVTPPSAQNGGNANNSTETTSPVDNAVVTPPSDQNGGNANNSTETTSPVDNVVVAAPANPNTGNVDNSTETASPAGNATVTPLAGNATAASASTYRPALNSQVPAYLVTNLALLEHSYMQAQTFAQNITQGTKNFYVLQQHRKATYDSNLGFSDYGYSYKSTTNSTLFGGRLDLNDKQRLHLGLALSKFSVEPKTTEIEGSSSAKYKSVGVLFTLENQLTEQSYVNLSGNYQYVRGKISTSQHKDLAKVRGHSWGIGAETGYHFLLNEVRLTPIIALQYQSSKANIEDHTFSWNINNDRQYIFTQQIGGEIAWKSLKFRTMYEHNTGNTPVLTLNDGTTQQYKTGKLGNALLFSASAGYDITPNLNISVQISHRKSLSDYGLKQTYFAGKLEYRF